MKLLVALSLCYLVSLSLCNPVTAQLRSGPMLGPVDMREAKIWVQTTTSASVFVEYTDQSAPSKQYRTQTIHTRAEDACVATLIADSVEPGRTYNYTVVINDAKQTRPYPTTFRTQPIWKWRSDSLPSMTMAFGSCNYVNESGYERHNKDGIESGYGSEYEIFTSIATKKPDVMVWLGDNTYLREADWNSRSGILKRYSHTRALPEMQPLLASTANYATWDDHDYGPNNSDRSFSGKGHALDAHRYFWPSPSSTVNYIGGITTSFEMLDVQIFLLDNRWNRTPEKRSDTAAKQTILGEHQIDWLIDALTSSTATFKIIAVGSQFISDNPQKESFVKFPKERQRIIELITQNKITGVLFITGDVHAAELSKLDRAGTYPLYEFTSSALTAGSNKTIKEQSNTYRVDGTAFGEHNFGMIEVSGKRKERILTLTLCDKDGKSIWTKQLTEKELR